MATGPKERMEHGPDAQPELRFSSHEVAQLEVEIVERPLGAGERSSRSHAQKTTAHWTNVQAFRFTVSLIRTATTTPDVNVKAATHHIATGSPKKSAMTPASRAPSA